MCAYKKEINQAMLTVWQYVENVDTVVMHGVTG